MDRRLLSHYNNELYHLRHMAAEFARQNPVQARRLGIDKEGKDACPDPYVERMLEGFAFLTARVQVKLDAEFPRLTQSLLETVYPHYLCPTPSMAMVQFAPDSGASQLVEGYSIPRGTVLRNNVRGERTACEYRTAQAVTLWPLEVEEAAYFSRDLARLDLPEGLRPRAALRLRLKTIGEVPVSQLTLDRLTFYLQGAAELPVTIYEQIFAHATAVIVQGITDTRTKPRSVLAASSISRVGFREEEALLECGPRSFQGYRLLREYFTFPQRFQFFEVAGLAEGLRGCPGGSFDLIIVFDQQEVRLEQSRVDSSCFKLYCTPVINLFEKSLDRILLSDRFSEFHVVPDKTRALDYEVFEVKSVTGYGVRSGEEQAFYPFYMARDTDAKTNAFFNTHRVPRTLSEKEKKFGQKSAYIGSEVYLSLVDANAAPYRTDLQHLGVVALCTNRHLPIQMAREGGDFSCEKAGPSVINCIVAPTQPRPAYVEGELGWRIVSHLCLNYLSLLDEKDGEGALALRHLLRLYVSEGDEVMKRQIDGVRSAQSRPTLRRVQTPGPITFARGQEVTVLLDEHAFEGMGAFILGAVLEQFFARYVSLNSFTETVVKTEQRGEIMRWKAKPGNRQMI